MCLIAVAWKTHPRFRLALIANRDEFHARPALPAQAYADAPQVFGGRDLEKGGSWLLAGSSGRVAAVTNVRVGRSPEIKPRSRGELIDQFAKSTTVIGDALQNLSTRAGEYGRFNLLLGTADDLRFASNHPQFRHRAVEPGVHGISNGDLDAPWPKTERARAALSAWLHSDAALADSPEVEPLFAALADQQPATDDSLPDTGIGIELERFLSSPFILGQDYGTRASTVLLVGERDAWLQERRFGPGGSALGETVLRFPVS